MSAASRELRRAIYELVADGVDTPGALWDALVEKYGDWRRLDLRMRMMQREELDTFIADVWGLSGDSAEEAGR